MNAKARKIVSIIVTALIAVGAVFFVIRNVRAPGQAKEETPVQPEEMLTVTIDIDCSIIYDDGNYEKLSQAVKDGGTLPKDGIIIENEEVELPENSTALDAVSRCCEENGIEIEITGGGGYGGYVRSVDGLSEGDCTQSSGWVYYVDGSEPDVGMSEHILTDGEEIKLEYILY